MHEQERKSRSCLVGRCGNLIGWLAEKEVVARGKPRLAFGSTPCRTVEGCVLTGQALEQQGLGLATKPCCRSRRATVVPTEPLLRDSPIRRACECQRNAPTG